MLVKSLIFFTFHSYWYLRTDTNILIISACKVKLVYTKIRLQELEVVAGLWIKSLFKLFHLTEWKVLFFSNIPSFTGRINGGYIYILEADLTGSRQDRCSLSLTISISEIDSLTTLILETDSVAISDKPPAIATQTLSKRHESADKLGQKGGKCRRIGLGSRKWHFPIFSYWLLTTRKFCDIMGIAGELESFLQSRQESFVLVLWKFQHEAPCFWLFKGVCEKIFILELAEKMLFSKKVAKEMVFWKFLSATLKILDKLL